MGFHDDELKLTITSDGFLVAEGWISPDYHDLFARCEFKRRFFIPSYVDRSSFSGVLTKDGFFRITGRFLMKDASLNSTDDDVSCRMIDITDLEDVRMLRNEEYINRKNRKTNSKSSGIGLNNDASNISLDNDANTLIPRKVETYFNDHCPKKNHEAYEFAVKKVLDVNKWPSTSNFMNDYRSLRKQDLCERTQAWCICEDIDDYLVS